MGDNFLGQIEFFAFGIVPKGWAQCNGQLVAISQNQALFSLLSTTFGGDGTTSFGLPNIQGRTVLGTGNGFAWGQTGGEEMHTLAVNEMPSHSHAMSGDATTAGSSNTYVPASNTVLGISVDYSQTGDTVVTYSGGAANGSMASGAVTSAGAGQPHENRMPYLVLNACIALVGIYPSRQ